ncbi:MAG: hybrid sensor histidine kinase/response regulator [Planctomycetota bacterium]|jgi:PAS domain S-box-containing protein
MTNSSEDNVPQCLGRLSIGRWKLYGLLAVLGAVLVGVLTYAFHTGRYMAAVHTPLVDAAMEIKLEATTAHLWCEEVLAGDHDHDAEGIRAHLDAAKWYARAMLEGGQSEEGTFIPLADPELQWEIQRVREKLGRFSDATDQRLAVGARAGAGTELDDTYDESFADFIAQADKVETALQAKIAYRMRRFAVLQYVLTASAVLLAVLAGIAFRQYELQKVKAFEDIHEARQRARANEKRLAIAMESTGDGLITTDANGRISYMNPVACELTAWSLDDAKGQPLAVVFRIVNEGTGQPADNSVANVLATKQITSVGDSTVLLARDGGARSVADSAAPITDDEGQLLGAVMVFRDVTDRRKLETERNRLAERIQHAQKLESLGVLAGSIAHDFNNLLMAMLGNADLALLELSPVSPARQDLEDIKAACGSAAELCKQMLAYAGKGRFVVAPINLSELIEEMAHMLDVSISKKAALRFNLHEPLPAIDADAGQIRQIIMNLVTNASEAIGDKSGVISISTGAVDCDRDYLATTHLADDLTEGMYVTVEIADTGCGMDAETRAKLFDPFFTTKFTGRGLGMAAVLGIVRGHRGAIKIYSESTKGTTIRLLFPAVEADTSLPADGAAEEDVFVGEGTVLLVDDEEAVRATAKKMLERLGFSVLSAQDGQRAVDIFRKHADEIICVVLDLTMPVMDGEETFRELRLVRQDVRVIMSSGYNQQEVAQRFLGTGLSGFIQKPYTVAALADVLRAATDG